MSLSTEQLTEPLKVLRRIQETSEAVSLVLEIPPSLKTKFAYKAGQFVTFFLTVNGETLNRSYSLSSSPLVDSEFKVTIKKVQGGRGSIFLCDQVKEGDILATTPPSGSFFKPTMQTKGTHYYLFAAGSGITPIFSILKTVLSASTLNHVTLLFCNRNQESIIYREELEDWARRHPQQLDVIHVLSKPADQWPGRSGRLDRTLMTEVLQMPTREASTREHYLCGPVEFMHLVSNTLFELGVSRELVHQESFGLTVHKPAALNDNWTLIGPDVEQTLEVPEKIIAILNGETIEVAAKPGQNILETLIEAGAQPPYSCMDGACMACLGKIVEGRVYQEDPGILMDENIKSCEALTCQAKPLSRIVKVSYDGL